MPSVDLSFLRTLSDQKNGAWGSKLYHAMQDVYQRITNVAQQTNTNPIGTPAPPPTVSGVDVSGQNGYLHVAITDQNQGLYRGIRYYVEHADNPHFTNPQIVPLHDTRNVTIAVGNQTRYVRAYSAYEASGPGAPVYHGSETNPIAVNGGGSDSGPAFLPSQGSGTGAQGQGLSGPGPIPYRTSTGKPPVR